MTRQVVLELAVARAAELGLQVVERGPHLAERSEWDEAFLTGTLTGLQAVVELDGEPIAGGTTGAWTRELGAALADVERRSGEPVVSPR